MNNIKLKKVTTDLKGKLYLSGSKSISNRVLIISELSDNEQDSIEFKNISDADDTQRLIRYLAQINSCSKQNLPLIINSENAGTVMRFLASFLTIKKGNWLLTGSKRMQHRPIGILVSALHELSTKISYARKDGFPPIRIVGGKLSGGVLQMDSTVSSQFISSIMMIAPYSHHGVTIKFIERPVSLPYIQMTQKLMQSFGAHVQLTDTFVKIKPSKYEIKDMCIEPDWSSASYWYEFAALARSSDIFLEGFTKNSVQGDSCAWQIFDSLGVHTSFKSDGIHLTSKKNHTNHLQYDFTDAPDLVPAVLTTCAAKRIEATITGVAHLAHKESDRMQALGAELAKIGAVLKSKNETYQLTFNGSYDVKKELFFETYKDHRMAMCFSPLVLKFDNILIKDKDVVEKSYPAFWNDLKKLKIVELNS